MSLLGPDSCRLTYTLDGQTVTVVLNKSEIMLGRDPACDVVLPTQLKIMSRRHARMTFEAGVWTISDLGSVNGTFVNDVRITTRPLSDLDVISLGPLTLTFHVGSAPPDSAEQRVHFEDQSNADAMVSVLSMGNLDQVLVSRIRGGNQPEGRASSDSRPPGLVPAELRPDTHEEENSSGGATRIIGLFRQVAQALLSTHDLDEMLERIMDLVFNNLPAERGSLFLCDQNTAAMKPRIVRVKVGSPNETIRISRSVANEVITSKNSVLVRDARSDERFRAAQSLQQDDIHSAMCAPLYNEGRVAGLIYVDSNSAERPFTKEHLEVLAALAVLSAVGVEQARLRQDILREQGIRVRLARYSSPSVVDQIVNSLEGWSTGMMAEDREVTVLFCDLSGFTAMSEDMAPADVARTLNEVFEFLTEAIFRHDGTLDKYRGDGLMAIFGAPLAQPEHAEKAIRTALLMQQQLAAFNRAHPGPNPMAIRIGINSGPVVAGDIGSPKRKDYTVIGDTVNVASRLEASVAQPGQVVIGPLTYEFAGAKFECQPLEPVQLKGKQRLVQPYLVLAAR